MNNIGLALAHNLLTEANWENVSLEEFANFTLDARGANANRVSLSGPDIMLPSKEAISIAMALHELCTNALKYGALSNDSGRVAVNWTRKDGAAPSLELQWTESGGPLVVSPRHRGFGSLLLERTLAQDLGGEVTIAFEPTGLSCSIVAPLTASERLDPPNAT